MQFTSKQAFAGRAAAENFSLAAYAFYMHTERLYIYEYETQDGTRYAYTGPIGARQDLTFDELQYIFEELARLTQNADAKTDPHT